MEKYQAPVLRIGVTCSIESLRDQMEMRVVSIESLRDWMEMRDVVNKLRLMKIGS